MNEDNSTSAAYNAEDTEASDVVQSCATDAVGVGSLETSADHHKVLTTEKTPDLPPSTITDSPIVVEELRSAPSSVLKNVGCQTLSPQQKDAAGAPGQINLKIRGELDHIAIASITD